jgi:hypothetical protein
LGHLPVFQLSDQLINGVGVVVREGSPRVWGELTDGIVYQDPIQDAGSFSRSEPPPYQPSVLGDLRAHRASHVEPPDMEALGSGSEAMTIIGQDGLLQGRVLAGVLRRQVLAGLLGRSGKKGGQDVRPLVLRPLLPSGRPLEYLQVRLHVVVRSELGEAAGWRGCRSLAPRLLGEPYHRLPEQSEALRGVSLVPLRGGGFRVLHRGWAGDSL